VLINPFYLLDRPRGQEEIVRISIEPDGRLVESSV
jgi:hypothetical protein